MQYWHPPSPEGLGTRGEGRDGGSQRGDRRPSWRDRRKVTCSSRSWRQRRDRAVDSRRGNWHGVGLCERGRMREESVDGGLWDVGEEPDTR